MNKYINKVHLYKNSVSLNTECEITRPKHITLKN